MPKYKKRGVFTSINFENCKKQLSYYFTNIIKVKDRIIGGELIGLPYMIFQRDQEKRILDERRRHLMYLNKKIKSQAKGDDHID